MTFDRAALTQREELSWRYHENLTDDAAEYLDGRGIGPDLRLKYRLGVSDDVFPGRLTIPYLRPPHGVLWFNYRSLDGSTPKYQAFGDKHVYNTAALDVADVTGTAFICEGEFDAIVATEHYELPAVGIPGATQWTGNPKFREMFVGYQRVYVLADPDEAGLALASAICESLASARVVPLPHDVADCWLKDIDITELVK